MTESRPGPAEGPRRVIRLLDVLDRLFFRDVDLRATARGWTVQRPRRFEREYRDTRFDLMVRCGTCDAEGTVGAHVCPDCDGRGRILRSEERVAT